MSDAIEAEVTGQDLSVEWGGHTYAVPATLDDCPIDVLEAIEEGQSAAALRGIFGRRQWAQLKARSNPKVSDLNALFDLVAATYGFVDAGE